jgi:hypothetical protein
MTPTTLDTMASWHDSFAQQLQLPAQQNEQVRAEREKHIRWAQQLRREVRRIDVVMTG